MANNYTQFSFAVKLDNYDRPTPEGERRCRSVYRYERQAA